MNSATVRQGGIADLQTLTPLFLAYRDFYGKQRDPQAAMDFLRQRFEHGDSVVFLAFEADTGVGFVQLYPSFSSAAMAKTLILNDLFVHAAHRRKGIGRRLIASAMSYAEVVGAARMTLSTGIDNTAAQAVYQSQGWRHDEAFRVYHWSPPTSPVI